MTLITGKQSSASDTCQNQMAELPNDLKCWPTALSVRLTSEPIGKMPKYHFVLKGEVCRGARKCNNFVLELVSSSRCIFPFHQGKVFVGSQWRAGEKQGGYLKQMVSTTPLRHLDMGYQYLAGIIARCCGPQLYRGKTPRSQISRDHRLALGAKPSPKWVQLLATKSQ